MAGTQIRWEYGDNEDGTWQSNCSRFEVSTDPTYGYYKLHRMGDRTESLGEGKSLAKMAQIAQELAASEQTSVPEVKTILPITLPIPLATYAFYLVFVAECMVLGLKIAMGFMLG
jgi:selenocysteine lyase/cysteine desulfurase